MHLKTTKVTYIGNHDAPYIGKPTNKLLCNESNEKPMKIQSIVPRAAIIFVSALVGASLDKVGDFDQVYSAVCGGIVAAVAVGIGALFNTKTKELENTTPPRKLLGLRIGVIGFCVAVVGWLVAVYASQPAGFVLAASGIGIGFVGMGIHYVNMFRK
ncbi:hypothetical protein [Geotalea uraniireducens]|uniref:hypothetical protein n=1 Tax=Geotalea uraniireducens TaxID=351604 RepID=UPI00059DA017|nr:hypothetical protein [Geotalea uraniireducens]